MLSNIKRIPFLQAVIFALICCYFTLFVACAGRIRISEFDSVEHWSEFGGGPLHENRRTDNYDEELTLLFKLKPRSMVGTTVVTGDNTVFCCTQKGMFQAFNLTKGKEIGLIKIKSPMLSAPVYNNRILYFTTIEGKYTIRAYNVAKAKYAWRENLGIFESPLTVSGDKLFAANRSGTAYCIDKNTGEVIWSYKADSEIFSGLLVIDNMVFIGSLNGVITSVDHGTGEKIWEYDTGQKLRATPSSDGNRIFWGTLDNSMIALDARSGQQLWRFTTGGAVFTTPSVAGSCIIFGCNDGVVYSLNPITGSEKWRFNVGAVVNTSCITVGSRIFFGALNEKIYALDSNDGTPLWEYPVEGRIVANPAYYDGKLIFPVEHRFLYVFGITEGS
ncbi:hypothetical protein AMJ80_05080 [bacterium SM23_31]|nr:MAG: hypothetical protein AMJ80_05080 [bacterium SM23_31]